MEKINYNGPYTGDLNDGKVIYYKNNDEECLKNYVWYSGKLWRIVAIYPDNKIIVPATIKRKVGLLNAFEYQQSSGNSSSYLNIGQY